jgi:anti-sigma factor RsiW
MSGRQFTTNDIHLALDGELSVDERDEFERWLETHPDMKALSARYARDRDVLAAALAPVLDEPLPPRLTELVSGEMRPRRSWSTLVRNAAAAVVLLAIGIAGGYGIGLTRIAGENPEEAIVGDAIAAHNMYAAEKLHVVEVGADQKDHLVGWLSKRVGTQIIAANFGGEGFDLIGGRLVPLDERPAAQLMYQNQSGDRVSVYVTVDKEGAETGFRRYDEQGARALYWVEKGYCYAVIGTVPEDKLNAIASSAYRQLLDRGTT